MNEELRERCIERMARVLWSRFDEYDAWRKDAWRADAGRALDALLALEGTCQTCGGERVVFNVGNAADPGEDVPCPTCSRADLDEAVELLDSVTSPEVLTDAIDKYPSWYQRVLAARAFLARVRPDTEGTD